METKKVIIAEGAPDPVGSYTHANIYQGIVYTAGQIALDPKTNTLVEGGMAEQTKQVMENLKAILEASGSSLDKVLKTIIYITDLSKFAEMDKVYSSYISSDFPGRVCAEVKGLPKGALIEMDMTAHL